MVSAAGGFGDGYAGFQPEGDGGVAQVVGAAGQRRHRRRSIWFRAEFFGLAGLDVLAQQAWVAPRLLGRPPLHLLLEAAGSDAADGLAGLATERRSEEVGEHGPPARVVVAARLAVQPPGAGVQGVADGGCFFQRRHGQG